MLHVWNIYQHLPHISSSFVATHTIQRGSWRSIQQLRKTAPGLLASRCHATLPGAIALVFFQEPDNDGKLNSMLAAKKENTQQNMAFLTPKFSEKLLSAFFYHHQQASSQETACNQSHIVVWKTSGVDHEMIPMDLCTS